MKEIQLKDAKPTLSAVVDDAVNGHAAVITRNVRHFKWMDVEIVDPCERLPST